MSVCRTEIPQVKPLEDILLLMGENSLEVIAETPYAHRLILVEYMPFNEPLVCAPAPVVIAFARRYVHQILCDTAFDWVDSHVVVVEDDEQVILVHRRVVQSLKRQSARHRSIPYNRHHSRLLTFDYSRSARKHLSTLDSRLSTLDS